jgi:ADP-ribose pyrophosphatase YjhB (NUDIX family)
MWHLPGGTVRFGESLTEAVYRVGGQELGNTLIIDSFLGYIEYPSHYNEGLDSPVGMAFQASLRGTFSDFELDDNKQWFTSLPDTMHEEQKRFLLDHQILKA